MMKTIERSYKQVSCILAWINDFPFTVTFLRRDDVFLHWMGRLALDITRASARLGRAGSRVR